MFRGGQANREVVYYKLTINRELPPEPVINDRDYDGVEDELDACPDVWGQKDNGCPATGKDKGGPVIDIPDDPPPDDGPDVGDGEEGEQ